MSGIESSYRINDMQPNSNGQFPYQQDKKGQESELMAQLTHIRDTLLVPSDPLLSQHLQRLDIPLTLFGIRWLRLLFGREFPLQDLLVLWDAIFAEAEGGSCFELVNFIVVAMLIAIRHQLLAGDYTTCLTYLMRYPGAVDISYIIEHSLYLKNPEKYCAPVTVSFPNLPVITIGGRNDMNRGPVDFLNMQQHQQHQPQSRSDSKQNDKKAKAAKKKGDGGLSKRLGKLSTGRWGKQQQRVEATEDSIVEGYSLDDPVVIPTELQRAVQLMRSSQTNLSLNLATLDAANIAADPAVRDALDGIRQIVIDLGSFQSIAMEVEAATEAGEIRSAMEINKAKSTPPPPVSATPPFSTVKLDVFRTSLGDSDKVLGAPLPDPLNTHS